MLTFILQFLFFSHKKIRGYRQSTGQCKNLPQQIKADLRITPPPLFSHTHPFQKKIYIQQNFSAHQNIGLEFSYYTALTMEGTIVARGP